MNRALFPFEAAQSIVDRALDEDLGVGGDITTRATVPIDLTGTTTLVARESTVAVGLPLIEQVMTTVARQVGGRVEVALLVDEGRSVAATTSLARLSGSVWPILAGERVLLNLVARLCGIATLTALAVEEVRGTHCRIADTRKTTPGLRALEKYAVAVAGGENHRTRLDQLVMVKDNHKTLVGGMMQVLAQLRAHGVPLSECEIEVDSLDELDLVIEAGAGWILLDNMSVEQVREAVSRTRGRARLEVSGGMRVGQLRPYAELGVDRISLGSLTHAAKAIDLALDAIA